MSEKSASLECSLLADYIRVSAGPLPTTIDIPDIISDIADLLPRSKQAVACRVCRQWLGVIRPKLWRTINDLPDLLLLLAPLYTEEGGNRVSIMIFRLEADGSLMNL